MAAAETSSALLDRPGQYDLVIVSRGAPLDGLEEYVARGGTAVFIDQHPGFAMPKPVSTVELRGTAYWRVRDRTGLPGFPDIDFVTAGGAPGDAPVPAEMAAAAAYMSHGGGKSLALYPADPAAILSLVPPMVENIAEEAASDFKDSFIPGLLVHKVGRGKLLFLPWDIGGIYYRFHMAEHMQLLMAVLRGPGGLRIEIESDAPSSVQVLVMDQPSAARKIVHLVNLSGQSQRGYSDPADFRSIKIGLRGHYPIVQSRALATRLETSHEGDMTVVTLPSLGVYDALVFST